MELGLLATFIPNELLINRKYHVITPCIGILMCHTQSVFSNTHA